GGLRLGVLQLGDAAAQVGQGRGLGVSGSGDGLLQVADLLLQIRDLLLQIRDLLLSGGGGGAAEQGQHGHGRRLLLGVSVGGVGGLAGDAQGGADVGPGRALGLGGGDQRPVDRAGRSGEVVGGGQRLQDRKSGA